MGTAYVFGEKCSGVRNMTGDIMQKRKMNTYIKMCRACGFFTGACLLATALSAMACKQTNKSDEETCRVAKVTIRTPCDLSIESQIKLLRQWRAGCEVSEAAVQAYGLQKCFEACAVDSVVAKRMSGLSYKADCPIPLPSLRYLRLLHYNGNGKPQIGEMVCHQSVANDLVSIFRQLYEAHYPIERMVLIDNYGADDERSMSANNTACFNYRRVAGSSKLSNHSWGRAVDVNPLYNPYVWHRKDGTLVVSPAKGRPYANRQRSFKYKITTDDLCYRLFRQHGFVWGGAWKHRKDFQHFEKRVQ